MSEYLFVYGTLRPSLVPEAVHSIVGQLEVVGDGFMFGRLYDLGAYPGAVLDDSRASKVFGTVYRLPDQEALQRELIAALDAYEGIDSASEKESLYLRKSSSATLPDGSMLECWVYVYNRDTAAQTPIPDGDYLAYLGEAKGLTAESQDAKSTVETL
jgi:gamma-glutamylcyclotransferase (GGCT)/AIG2-like uncharacterized protein YtfP